MTSKEIIAETDDVIAIEQNCGSSSVVVTFNEMGFVRNGVSFWGDSFFLKLGITAIGIVTPRPNWYPPEAMNTVVSAIRQKTGDKRVVTYGHSQGGYGALKYSSRLGASVALAFSPQWSINPKDVKSFDTRFTKYFDESKFNGHRIEENDLCESSFIFFDRFDRADAANAAKLADMRCIKSVLTPFTMHDTIRLATEGRSAAKIISLCTADAAPTAAEMRRMLRAGRRQSKTYANHLSRELVLRMSRSKRRSSLFADRWIRKAGTSPYFLALISHAKGDSAGAAAELTKLNQHGLEQQDLMLYWQLANRLRFDDAELHVASQILEKSSDNIWACLHVVNTYIRTGKLEQAAAELTRLARHQDAAGYLGYVADFAMKLEKAEILESILSKRLVAKDQNAVVFKLIEFYIQSGDRHRALRKLMELESSGLCNPLEIKRIADLLVKINEFGFALEIRLRLLQAAKNDIEAALDVVEARLPLDKSQSVAELNSIVAKSEISPQHLERASYLYDRLGDLAQAALVIHRAASMPSAGPGVRHRLAYLSFRQRKIRRARTLLDGLMVECVNDPRRLRALGDLAAQLPDPALYRRFAEAQHRCDPTDADGILYLARSWRRTGENDRAQKLLTALCSTALQSAAISDRHWVVLAQELFESGEKVLVLDAAREAFARQPKDAGAVKLNSALSVLQRFGTNRSGSAPSISRTNASSPSVLKKMAAIFLSRAGH